MQLTKELINAAYRKAMNQDIREQDNNTITAFAEALFDEFKALSVKETVNNSLVEMIHAYIDSITDYKNDSVILPENTFDRLNILLYSLGIPLPDNVKRQTTLKEPVTLKCELCDYTGTETNPVGECPKCKWDALLPVDENKQAKNEMLEYQKCGCKQTTGNCTLAGPGRGDCEHHTGLPGVSIPGQHDGSDDTVDAYGKPNGWCWQCWKSKQIAASNKTIESTVEVHEVKIYDFEKEEIFIYQINDPTSSVDTSSIIESINERLHRNMIYAAKLKMFTPEELLDEKIKKLTLELQAAETIIATEEFRHSDLNSNEQYRLQMAGICTAAIGYWKIGDSVHPNYMTPALVDVANLYARYDELYKLCEKHNLVGCQPAEGDTKNWKENENLKYNNQPELPLTITQEYVDELCGDPEKAHYTVFPETNHTVCCIKLPNGSTMIGESVCASNKIFNEKLGREYAFEQAKEKVWQFEGYALCEKRYQAGLQK